MSKPHRRRKTPNRRTVGHCPAFPWKTRHMSKRAAWASIIAMILGGTARRDPTTGKIPKYNVFRCHRCGRWHVGTDSYKNRRAG